MKNIDWEVPPPPKDIEETTLVEPAQTQKTLLTRKRLIIAGISGLVLWIVFGLPKTKQSIIEISKSEAIQIAQNSLTDFDIFNIF